MPEPITAPLEQALPGTPQQTQQEPVQAGNQPVQQAPSGDQPTAEQVAQWRSQAEQSTQLADRVRQQDEQFKSLQADYTRKSQALAQLASAAPQQPPADPLAPYVQQLVAKGYDAKQARDMAEMNMAMSQQLVAPLQQELQATRNAMAIEPQIKGSLDGLVSTSPHLFATPGVYERAMQDVRTAVQQGMRVDDKFVRQMTLLAADELSEGKPQQTAPTPQPQIFANGINRPATGYPHAQPLSQQAQLSPDQVAADAFIKQQFNIPAAK